ncbi:MAG TPA: metalloregulator ArsR/SmtB family transcription factor [Acidimicrobiia bacterium]|jgi:DNA-binding transcriptional ArsR family regulator
MGRLNPEAALRAIAHPGRRRMLELAWDGERTASDLAKRCRMSPPAASQHLKVLREADLLAVRTAGNRRFYRVRAEKVAELASLLDLFWGDKLTRLHEEMTASRTGEER